jgi:hypothetical protein
MDLGGRGLGEASTFGGYSDAAAMRGRVLESGRKPRA